MSVIRIKIVRIYSIHLLMTRYPTGLVAAGLIEAAAKRPPRFVNQFTARVVEDHCWGREGGAALEV
jgi:hypothetical protein